MPNEIRITDLTVDPVGIGAEPQSPQQFTGSLMDRTVEELEDLLQALETELAQPNARGQARRELDEVVWELERREADRRTQERRRGNITASLQDDVKSMDGEPGVWVHGRSLDARERADLATFIRWVVRGNSA
ncbi:hypothetical protein BH20ACT21_BH20ACT21_12680 [soil metagenome]